MIATENAETKASEVVTEYLEYCSCENPEEIAETLALLITVAGRSTKEAIGGEPAMTLMVSVAQTVYLDNGEAVAEAEPEATEGEAL